jgi:hypothetical protein
MYQSDPDSAPERPATAASDDPITDSVTDGSSASAPTANVPARDFTTELAHAMQTVAEREHEATNEELQAVTTAHLERVRARAAAEAEELRRRAQQDIDAINAWQKAEAGRIRAEAARRIVVRSEELDSYLGRHAAIIDSEIEQIEGVVASYQLDLDDYFDRLTSEPNPGVIARLAAEMPEPPNLAEAGRDARANALAAVDAEFDAAVDSDSSAEAVPVMDPAAAAAGMAAAGITGADAANARGSDGSATDGSDGEGGERTNRAVRLWRSIATLAAPGQEKTAGPTDGTTDRTPSGAEHEASTDEVDEVAPEAVEATSN